MKIEAFITAIAAIFACVFDELQKIEVKVEVIAVIFASVFKIVRMPVIFLSAEIPPKIETFTPLFETDCRHYIVHIHRNYIEDRFMDSFVFPMKVHAVKIAYRKRVLDEMPHGYFKVINGIQYVIVTSDPAMPKCNSRHPKRLKVNTR